MCVWVFFFLSFLFFVTGSRREANSHAKNVPLRNKTRAGFQTGRGARTATMKHKRWLLLLPLLLLLLCKLAPVSFGAQWFHFDFFCFPLFTTRLLFSFSLLILLFSFFFSFLAWGRGGASNQSRKIGSLRGCLPVCRALKI